MKRLLALLLALVMVLSVFVGCSRDPDEPENPTDVTTEPTEVDDGICETAQECIDNITVGWNLGCSLSAFASENIDAWGVMAYFHTVDKLYSRSEVHMFDPETRTAEISWILGKDGGVMQVYEGALMDYIGIELWNFSLGEADVLKYSIDELRYVTADGEVNVTEGIGEQSTDMSGGTGGGPVADLEEPAVADIQEIHAKVTFIEQTKGESTPESIAAAEMSWGNPLTTQAMIDKVRDRGFNMIRVQVSYVNHMDAEGNIDPLWLERVAEVVDYCMNAGVYCLINTTGAGWMTADPETFEEQSKIYARLWEQIAARFANYGELLLFESCNEVLNSNNQWWNPPAECYDVMNGFYQVFVDTVRAGGGYNETRNLVLNPYAAAYDYHMNQGFKLPEDTVEGHLIAQVHCYEPNTFCFNETNLGSTNFANEWGTDAEKRKIDDIMKNIRKRFIEELGIPVIIGEFGTVNRVVEEERAEYVGYYAKAADENGIKLIIFDDGGDFTVFDRTTLIWPYVKIIDALFAKDAPAHDVEDEVVELDESVEGWQALVYFSGTDGSWNRSAPVNFDAETNMAEIVWKLGKDDGILGAGATAGIDGLGVELWNWDKSNSDFAKYVVEEIIMVTDSGERVVEDGLGEYSTDMSGGTGGGTVCDLMDNPTVGKVSEIRVKVKLLGSYTKDMGPAKEPLDVPDSVPSPSVVNSPMEGWSAKIYMSATDFSYNTSVATSFDAATKTAKIIWILGQDEGVYTAQANAGIDIIGVDLWNFSLDEKTTINYWIEDLKYYTTKKTVDVPVLQSSFKTDMSGGTGGGTVADLDAPALSDIVAIYMEVRIDAKTSGAGTTGSTVSSLPSVSTPANALENYQAILYLATNQTGFNRSDPPVSFDANTKTAEVLWKLEDGRASGMVTAGKNEGLTVIGAQIYNFAEKPASVKYTVESLKYYTKSGSAYKENVVSLSKKNFTTSLAASGAGGGTVTSLAVPPAVGDVVAIYAKIKLNLPEPGAEPEPEPEVPAGLPEVTPSANPMTTGVRMYLATKQTGYNTSAYGNFDADTKQTEILWMMNDGTVTAGPSELLGVVGLEAADFTLKPAQLKVRIDEMKYYTASGDSAVAHDMPVSQTEWTYNLSGGQEGKVPCNFGETGPAIGDVVAIYLKASIVEDQMPEEPKPEVGLPEITAPADPTPGGARIYLADPYTASVYSNFSTATGVGEILWRLDDGNMAAHAEKALTDICVEVTDSVNKPAAQKVQIQALKYYVPVEGGFEEVEIPITAADLTMDLSTGTAGAAIGKVAETITIGEVAAIYLKLALVSGEEPDVPDEPAVQLPEITAPADPTYTGVRLYLAEPWVPSAYSNFSIATGVGEVLWRLDDGSMAAHADKTLADICVETTNYAETLTTLNVQVEALKYYVAIEGGYKEVEIPITNGQLVMDMTGQTCGKAVGKVAENITIGEVAAIYTKVKLVDSFEPSKPAVQLPEITAPADPTYTGVRLYLAEPWVPSAYSNFSIATGVGEVLWRLDDGSMAAHADKALADICVETTNYAETLTTLNVQVEALKYYVAIEGGYKEVEIPITNGQLVMDMTGQTCGKAVGKVAEDITIGEVAAIYTKVKLVDEFAEIVEKLPEITPPGDGTYTGFRLFLTEPWAASTYHYYSGSTGVGELLWRLDDASMTSFADIILDDISVELTNYAETLTTLNFKVDELNYYVATEGGYVVHKIKVETPDKVADMSALTVSVELGKLDEEIKVGDITAIYLKITVDTKPANKSLPRMIAMLADAPEIELKGEDE